MQQRQGLLRWLPLGSVALALVSGLGSCAEAEDGCLWEVEDLLERVRANVPDERVYCGMVFDGGDLAQADALDCFSSAADGVATELLVNHCIDCFAISRYFRNSRSEIFGVHQGASRLDQEPPRRASVTRCAALRVERGYVKCTPPEEELYSCAEPESAYDPEPPPPPGPPAPGTSPPSGAP